MYSNRKSFKIKMSTEGDRTEVARIVIGHAEKICIHTGNIICWKLLKKIQAQPLMTATDEVCHFFILYILSSINIISSAARGSGTGFEHPLPINKPFRHACAYWTSSNLG